jgi:hypothetical protein
MRELAHAAVILNLLFDSCHVPVLNNVYALQKETISKILMIVEQLTTSFSDGIGIAFNYNMHSKGNNSVSA